METLFEAKKDKEPPKEEVEKSEAFKMPQPPLKECKPPLSNPQRLKNERVDGQS